MGATRRSDLKCIEVEIDDTQNERKSATDPARLGKGGMASLLEKAAYLGLLDIGLSRGVHHLENTQADPYSKMIREYKQWIASGKRLQDCRVQTGLGVRVARVVKMQVAGVDSKWIPPKCRTLQSAGFGLAKVRARIRELLRCFTLIFQFQ